jgi:putative spermidine/putrescine transport system permease protein
MTTGRGRALLIAFCSLVGLVLVAPTLIVIPLSFTDRPTFQFPPKGWSTRWYENFFSDPAWYQSALNSLKIASIVVVLATVLGTAAAFGLTRGRGRWRAPAQAMLLAPMIVPGVVTAIAIYYVFLRWHLVATTPGFVLAHTVLALPLVVVTVSSTLQTMDRRLEQAAASLGAGPGATFRRVTLPLIMPGVLTAALFAFITSFDEAIVSLFLVGPFDRTLPVQMYTSVSASVDPTIAAASTMTIILTTSLLFVAAILITRRRARVG